MPLLRFLGLPYSHSLLFWALIILKYILAIFNADNETLHAWQCRTVGGGSSLFALIRLHRSCCGVVARPLQLDGAYDWNFGCLVHFDEVKIYSSLGRHCNAAGTYVDSIWISSSLVRVTVCGFGVLIQVYWTACDWLYAAIRFAHLVVDLWPMVSTFDCCRMHIQFTASLLQIKTMHMDDCDDLLEK